MPRMPRPQPANMGYYQDLDEARYDYLDVERENELNRRDKDWSAMADRFRANGQAEVGATIECACCARKVVKRTYHQRFCPPVLKGKRKTYPCKDRYHNIMNPRGKFAHLG